MQTSACRSHVVVFGCHERPRLGCRSTCHQAGWSGTRPNRVRGRWRGSPVQSSGGLRAARKLDRALGRENVEIRDTCNNEMLNWPTHYRDLARYDLAVLTDVPSSQSGQQLQDLHRYVLEGGCLILMGRMAGNLPKPADAWFNDLIPMKPIGTSRIRPLDTPAKDTPLFKRIPLESVKFTARNHRDKAGRRCNARG